MSKLARLTKKSIKGARGSLYPRLLQSRDRNASTKYVVAWSEIYNQ